MTDLTSEEQARVRAALRYLHARIGHWKATAKALGFSPHTIRHVDHGEKNVSAALALRVARLAGAPVDDVLTGKYPPAGTCPHCGRNPNI